MQRVRGASKPRREAGETLIESLASVVLLSIVTVGVVGALGSDVIASARDRKLATTETVARSFAAWVDGHVGATSATFRQCSGNVNPYYGSGSGQWTSPSLGYSPPAGFDASVVSWGPNLAWGSQGGVGYWSADSAALAGNPQTTCPGSDALLQLTLLVTSSDGAAAGTGAQSVDVVVRRP